MANTHPRSDTLRAYAAGTLPPGLALLVATHLGFCRCCRDKVAGLEALCGALLASAEPVAPTRRCLSQALARLDTCAPAREAPAPDGPLPAPLCHQVGPLSGLRWTDRADGLTEAALSGFPTEHVALIRARPGARLSLQAGASHDALLVLTGSLLAGDTRYQTGDVALDCCRRAAVADPCLCLLVQPQMPV